MGGYQMHNSKVMDNQIIAAVRACGHSINSTNTFVAALAQLADLTSHLPLENFEYWEGTMRFAFADAVPQADAPPAWRIWSRSRTRLTWLDLISADGYRREKTLRALSGALPNAFIFSLALRRLNDWVPQVRKAARDALPDIARASQPQHVSEALCVALHHWDAWGRIEEADQEILLSIIGETRIAEPLKDILISSTSGPMPSLFAQLGRTAILDERVEEIAHLAVQPAVRAKAYRSLFEQRILWVEGWVHEWVDLRYCQSHWVRKISERPLKVSTPVSELLSNAAQDRSSLVRRLAAEILIQELENPDVASRALAERFAADPSSAVAERGAFAIKKLEQYDLAAQAKTL